MHIPKIVRAGPAGEFIFLQRRARVYIFIFFACLCAPCVLRNHKKFLFRNLE